MDMGCNGRRLRTFNIIAHIGTYHVGLQVLARTKYKMKKKIIFILKIRSIFALQCKHNIFLL